MGWNALDVRFRPITRRRHLHGDQDQERALISGPAGAARTLMSACWERTWANDRFHSAIAVTLPLLHYCDFVEG